MSEQEAIVKEIFVRTSKHFSFGARVTCEFAP
jgi:hypothetical protein